MSLRRIIRINLVERLPKKYQLLIERLYLYYYIGIGSEVKIIKKLCNPKKNSLDIGANEGDITLFLCKFSSHVYCFEPIPRLNTYLRHRFQGCNVSIENYALGDVNNESYLSIPFIGNKKFETRSSLIIQFDNKDILGEKISAVEKIKVKVRKLDDFHISNVGFIKIDVEGFELNVLEGAKETIKQNMPNMYIEIEQRYHNETNIYNIFQYIIDIGYFGYFIYNNKIRKINEFETKIYQNKKNEKGKGVYINNFIFSASPFLT